MIKIINPVGEEFDVDLEEVFVADNAETNMVSLVRQLDKKEQILFQVIKNVKYRAFFRLLFYYEDFNRLEEKCGKELDFCSYKFIIPSIEEMMFFLELFYFEKNFIAEIDF